MIAALPMYHRAETADATDRLWAGIRDGLRDRGIAAPKALTRDMDLWDVWTSSEMVFAQTCGLPLRARLMDKVAVLGSPVFDLPDCPPGDYYSVIVARPGALPTAPRLAVNDPLSQSGWANLLEWLEDTGTIAGPATLTGAHRASARAVAEGAADLAAIDAQTWWLIEAHDPWSHDLSVIGRTRAIAGLPFIAPPGADIETYRAAVAAAIQALPAGDRAALNLTGFHPLSAAAYADRKIPPAP